MKFGIIGNGFVGNATSLLSCADNECIIYDIDPSKCNPLNTTLNDIYSCDIIFIAVPSPNDVIFSCAEAPGKSYAIVVSNPNPKSG